MEDLGYDSFYEIMNPKLFGEILFVEAQKFLRIKLKRNAKLKWKLIAKPVTYGQRTNIRFNDHIDLLEFMLFRKPSVSQINKNIEYWKNTEFRFTWLFFKNDSIIPLPVDFSPIQIPNNNVLNLIK